MQRKILPDMEVSEPFSRVRYTTNLEYPNITSNSFSRKKIEKFITLQSYRQRLQNQEVKLQGESLMKRKNKKRLLWNHEKRLRMGN